MHHTKSGVCGIFFGLFSVPCLINSFAVHAMEKESKPSVSDSKAAQEKAQGTEVKSFTKKHESTRSQRCTPTARAHQQQAHPVNLELELANR